MPKSKGSQLVARIALCFMAVMFFFVAFLFAVESKPLHSILLYVWAALFAFIGAAMVWRAIAGLKLAPLKSNRVYTKDPPESNFHHHS